MKWNEYARAGTASYIIVPSRGTGGSGEEKVLLGLAKPFRGQRVENMVRSATDNAQRWEFQEKGRKAGLQGFYYRRVFRITELVDCAVLKEINLTAREVLSQKALNWKVNELGKQKRRTREQSGSRNERLRRALNELEAAEKTTARLEGAVQGC